MFFDIFTIFSAIMKVTTMIFMILLLHIKIALLNLFSKYFLLGIYIPKNLLCNDDTKKVYFSAMRL